MRVSLAEAITLLKRGEVVAIPTETVYGLAGDVQNESALHKIYATKQRPANNPLSVHIASAAQVDDFAAEFPPLAQKLAQAFWPGPLTIVLKSKPHVSSIVRANAPTVALRVPAHPLTLKLLNESGLALAAPSANRYTQLSPTTAAHVEASLGADTPVLDGGACQVGIESTIVSVESEEWQLLRHGMVSIAQIEEVTGKPPLQHASVIPKAPGQHALHYSPRTPTLLFQDLPTLEEYAKQHPNCAALLIGEHIDNATVDSALLSDRYCIRLSNQPLQVAEHLYEAMHTLDQLQAHAMLILLPPPNPMWAAILDRLMRAGYREAGSPPPL
jgi:L-threonylcarbamoyladenylate synthase